MCKTFNLWTVLVGKRHIHLDGSIIITGQKWGLMIGEVNLNLKLHCVTFGKDMIPLVLFPS